MTSVRVFTVLFLLAIGLTAHGQKNPAAEAAFDSAYAERILMEEINGVYIPSSLADAFTELRRLTSSADLDKFRTAPENVVSSRLHFGLGRWIIHNWGFYEGSRLSHSLKTMGLEHPDDMARLIIVTFHRKLNDVPLEIEQLVDHYMVIREQERVQREGQKELIHEETRLRKKN